MKNDKKLSTILDWIIASVFILGFGITLGYAIVGNIVRSSDYADYREERLSPYQATWTWTDEKDNVRTVELPGIVNAKPGEKVILESILPEAIPDNTIFCVASAKQDMSIYIDGTVRLEYSTADTRFWGKSSTYRYLFVKLSRDDAGKPVRIEAVTKSKYAGQFPVFYLGSALSVLTELFKADVVEVIIGAFLLGIYSVGFIISSIVSIYYRKPLNLMYFLCSGAFTSIWILCNSSLRQYYLKNASIANDMAYIMLMFIPMMLILYADSVQKKKYHAYYRIIQAAICANLMVQYVLQTSDRMDFSNMIIVSAIIFIAAFIMIITFVLIDLFKYKYYEYISIAIGFLVGAILTIIQFILYSSRVIEFNGINVAIAILVMTVAAFCNTFFDLKKIEKDRAEVVARGRAESSFLANMSHEIRTPINAILGMDELILRSDISSETREYATDIRNASQTLLKIVNDVLDQARIRSGKMTINPVEYSLSQIVHEMQTMFSMRAEQKGLKLEVIVNENIPDRYFGDDVRIRQIISNLISNAIKYTEDGIVSFQINGTRISDCETLHILVSDTGIGVKDEDMDKLMSAFGRVDLSKNRNIEGTGLGLSITQSLLNMMDSELKVESVYGVGSRFMFDLKQNVVGDISYKQAKDKSKDTELISSEKLKYVAPKARILVADDNEPNIKVFCNLLRPLKMHIDTAKNGEEAVEMSRRNKYDLIFLDHMMPVMDGVEAMHAISSDASNANCDTIMIALTANAVGDARKKYIDEGFKWVLFKPFEPRELDAAVLGLLDQELLEAADYDDISQSEKNDKYDIEGNSELPEIAGIEWSEAKKNLPERSLLISVIKDFCEAAKRETDALKKFYDAAVFEKSGEMLKEYRIKVHALKNNAALIGAMKLSEEAKTLEYAARDAMIEAVEAGSDLFCTNYLQMAENLADKFGFSTGGNVNDKLSAEDMLKALDVVRRAMKEFDIAAMNSVMEDLEKYSYTTAQKEELDRLSGAVLDLDAEVLYDAADKLEVLFK